MGVAFVLAAGTFLLGTGLEAVAGAGFCCFVIDFLGGLTGSWGAMVEVEDRYGRSIINFAGELKSLLGSYHNASSRASSTKLFGLLFVARGTDRIQSRSWVPYSWGVENLPHVLASSLLLDLGPPGADLQALREVCCDALEGVLGVIPIAEARLQVKVRALTHVSLNISKVGASAFFELCNVVLHLVKVLLACAALYKGDVIDRRHDEVME
ncbi:hypothetical protein PG990_007406 [Apiospora arundinis]